MPKKVSGTPHRQSRKPKRRVPVQAEAPSAAPISETPVERPRVESPSRSPYGGRVRALATPVVDYHNVLEDLKRVSIIAVAMFAILGILAVLLR